MFINQRNFHNKDLNKNKRNLEIRGIFQKIKRSCRTDGYFELLNSFVPKNDDICMISSISVSDYVSITLTLSQYLLLAKKSFQIQKKSKFEKI